MKTALYYMPRKNCDYGENGVLGVSGRLSTYNTVQPWCMENLEPVTRAYCTGIHRDCFYNPQEVSWYLDT